MRQGTIIGSFCFTVIVFITTSAAFSGPFEIDWVDQFGSFDVDTAENLALHASGDLYVVGSSLGYLDNPEAKPPLRNYSGYLRKYDRTGNHQWTYQLDRGNGLTSRSCQDVVADGLGNAYVIGAFATSGTTTADDDYIAKYNGNGELIWFANGSVGEKATISSAVLTPSGNVVVAGNRGYSAAQDAGLWEYGPNGDLLWGQTFDSTDHQFDTFNDVTTDSNGNLYTTGGTYGMFGGDNAGSYDAFLTKHDSEGNLLWRKQFGKAGQDSGMKVLATPDSSVFVCGYGYESPNASTTGEGFLAKYSADGELIWYRESGLSEFDYMAGLAIAPNGDLLVAGTACLGLGGRDVYLSRYDISGDLLWTMPLGTSADDNVNDMLVDSSGAIYLAGITEGDMSGMVGPSLKYCDAFVARLVPVPEPGTLTLLFMGAVGFLFFYIRRRRP